MRTKYDTHGSMNAHTQSKKLTELRWILSLLLFYVCVCSSLSSISVVFSFSLQSTLFHALWQLPKQACITHFQTLQLSSIDFYIVNNFFERRPYFAMITKKIWHAWLVKRFSIGKRCFIFCSFGDKSLYRNCDSLLWKFRLSNA